MPFDLSKSRIHVSKHVQERVFERFGSRFRQYTGNSQMLRNLIIGQVSTGDFLQDWKTHPFYKNQMDHKYGLGTEIIRKSGVYYVARYTEETDQLSVVTAVPAILYYPRENAIAVPTKGGARFYNELEYTNRLHEQALKEYKRRENGTPKQVHAEKPDVIAAQAEVHRRKSVKNQIEQIKNQVWTCQMKLRSKPRDAKLLAKIKDLNTELKIRLDSLK